MTRDPSSPWSRRDVLRAGAVALAGTAGAAARSVLAPAAARAQEAGVPDDLMRGCIDAHSHVWTPDIERYPLAAGFAAAQMDPPSFTPRQLMSHARPCGVDRVVLIQMNYYGFDNSYMLDSIRDAPKTFRGVAVIDEHAADARQTMRALKGQGVRGFRIHPGEQKVDAWLSSPAMAAMWRAGADDELAMCALVNPNALMALDKMCGRFPKTRLVIDHFARIGIDGTVPSADVDNLCRLARHPQTYVKISAFYALGAKQAPYTDLAPMIRRLVDAFGCERLMWATDCPYQVGGGHAYCDSIELVRSRLDFLSHDDRRRLLRGTAETVFFG